MKISATKKGLITGLLMVATGILLYIFKVEDGSALQYTGLLIYGLGIVWSIADFSRWVQGSVKFGDLFNQGFKCFVVVTLFMAIYTFVFYKSNPKIIDEKGALAKQELLKTEKNRTPKEIEDQIENSKKYFPLFSASGAIFQYLFIGAVVSMATAGSLYLRNKKS